MKRITIKLGLLMLVLFLYGCLPSLSLQPLYTDDTIVFDEAILGKWYGDGGSWSFTKEGNSQYILRRADLKEANYNVHLVQLGDHHFIDLYPADNKELENIAGTYHQNLVTAHTFMKLDLSEPNLLLQWVSFNDVIADSPEILKHEKYDDDSILITAAPEDIQKVLIEKLDEVLVGDASVMRKSPVDFSQIDTLFDMNLLGQWESDDGDYLDIIASDNGYDILYSDSQEQQRFKGILYNLNDQPVLGLCVGLDDSKESEAEEHYFQPDFLIQIECDEQQLKTQTIEWDEVEPFMNGSSKYSFEKSDPDVFLKVSD